MDVPLPCPWLMEKSDVIYKTEYRHLNGPFETGSSDLQLVN